MLDRRGFFGGLLGLFGLGGAAKAATIKKEPVAYKRLLNAMRNMAPCGWTSDHWEELYNLKQSAYIAIQRRAEIFAQSTFNVYKKDLTLPDGRRLVTTIEEGWKLVEILHHPNNDDTWKTLCYQWSQQLDIHGTALTWMVPNMWKIPHELYVIPTTEAIPHPAKPDYPDGFYACASDSNPAYRHIIPAQQMLRFKYSHPILRYDGYSPLQAIAIEDHCRRHQCANSIYPSAILNMNGASVSQMTKEELEKIRADSKKQFEGKNKKGSVYVAAPVTEVTMAFSDPFHASALAKRISVYLTKYLAPHFGSDLEIEITAPEIKVSS